MFPPRTPHAFATKDELLERHSPNNVRSGVQNQPCEHDIDYFPSSCVRAYLQVST